MEPTVLKHGQKEYDTLILVASILTFMSPNKVRYKVRDVYFDYGQNWMWTTVIAERPDRTEWQALNPAEWGKLMMAETVEDIVAITKEVGHDKFNPDKWEDE